MTRALLQQALEALYPLRPADAQGRGRVMPSQYDVERAQATIKAIHEYLDKTKEQEPVAWMHPTGGVIKTRYTGLEEQTYTIPLYLHPNGDE